MREIRTEIVLDATPGAVWEALTDLEAYESWNPQTVAASGDVAAGERVELTVLSGGRERRMAASVVDADPGRRLEWVSTLGGRWLFEARHTFEIEPLEDGRTRLVNREALSGVLVRFAVPDDAGAGYEAMNRALAGRLADAPPVAVA